ncbi:MAG: tyrosine-type recombinase/integrase [Actinomycetota bacterium]
MRRRGNVLAEAEQTWEFALQSHRRHPPLPFTSCCSAEILNPQWNDVDFEPRCLHLRGSKTGKHTIILMEAALDILANLERFETNQNVVPGLKPGTRRSPLQPLWKPIRETAALDDVRIHDLKHTYASVGANNGHSLAVLGKLFGHNQAHHYPALLPPGRCTDPIDDRDHRSHGGGVNGIAGDQTQRRP